MQDDELAGVVRTDILGDVQGDAALISARRGQAAKETFDDLFLVRCAFEQVRELVDELSISVRT